MLMKESGYGHVSGADLGGGFLGLQPPQIALSSFPASLVPRSLNSSIGGGSVNQENARKRRGRGSSSASNYYTVKFYAILNTRDMCNFTCVKAPCYLCVCVVVS